MVVVHGTETSTRRRTVSPYCTARDPWLRSVVTQRQRQRERGRSEKKEKKNTARQEGGPEEEDVLAFLRCWLRGTSPEIGALETCGLASIQLREREKESAGCERERQRTRAGRRRVCSVIYLLLAGRTGEGGGQEARERQETRLDNTHNVFVAQLEAPAVSSWLRARLVRHGG